MSKSKEEPIFRMTFKEETSFTVYVVARNRNLAQKWATANLDNICRGTPSTQKERYCEDCELETYDPKVMAPDVVLDDAGKVIEKDT